MNAVEQPWLAELTGMSVFQATVLSAIGDEVVALPSAEGSEPIAAALLHSTDHATLQLTPGDTVLLWRPSSDATRGVVLGRIGPSPTRETVVEADPPDTLVLEARERLVLRVGDGSIEIRADGKILIKGTDLVSHAKRMNRIKGGAVSIN